MADTTARIVLSAKDDTKAAMETARRNLASVQSSTSELVGKFGALGTAISAAFASSSVVGAINTLDMLDDLSEKYGVAAEALSVYRYASEVAGTTTDSLASGLNKLSKNLVAAAGGAKEQTAWFKALGVSVRDSNGNVRDAGEALLDIADKFATYEDGAEKAALAQGGFGKSGADMIPLLNRGRAGISELIKEAKLLGVVYGNDLAKSAGEFNDNLKRLQLASEGAKVALAGGLLDTLVRVTNELVEGRKAFGGYFSAVYQIGFKTAPFETYEEGARNARKEIELLNQQLEKAQRPAPMKPVESAGGAAFGVYPTQRGGAGATESVKGQLEDAKKRLAYFERMAEVEKKLKEVRADGGPAKGRAPVVADAAAEAANAQYESLVERLNKQIALSQSAIDAGRPLTDGEKSRAELEVTLKRMESQLSASKIAMVKGLNEEAITKAEIVALDEKALKLGLEEVERVEASIRAVEAESAAIFEGTKALNEQIAAIGLNSRELEKLAIARLEAAAAAKAGDVADAERTGIGVAALPAMREQLRLLQDQARVRKELAARTSREEDDPLAGATRALQRYSEEVSKAGNAAEAAVSRSLGTLEDGLTNLFTGKSSGAREFVDEVVREMVRLQVVKPLINSLFAGGNGNSGIGTFIFDLIRGGSFGWGGPRALGGPVEGGTAYLVGERGPEMFVPRQSGQIVPTQRLATAGDTVVINSTLNVGSGVSRSEFAAALKAHDAQMKADILRSRNRGGAFS